jgi:hypothetical protein
MTPGTTHGSPTAGYSFGTLRSKYKIRTLIDVSPTGIISEFRKDIPLPFIDDLKNIINNTETWNTSRNEQRNWETFIQCISIRSQPILLEKPVIEEISVGPLGFTGFKGKKKVWTFEFGFETPDIYIDDGDAVKLLKDQLDMVPIVTKLRETVTLSSSIIATTGVKVNTLCFHIPL